MKFGQKVQEFIYLLSTSDKYSEFDSRKSFNRINKPDSQNLLGHHHNNSSLELVSNINEDSNNLQGVHEVNLAWRHIKNWLTKYSSDINNSLQSKCTDADLQDFQKDLNIKLPNCVIQYFKLVDGQYSDFESSGLIFGLKLMSLDEITIAADNWRKVAAYLNQQLRENFQSEIAKLPTSHSSTNQYTKKLSGVSGASGSTSGGSIHRNFGSEGSSRRTSFDLSVASLSTLETTTSNRQTSTMPKQRSIPPNTIHETLAHPMWIPLVTDEVGNYIGIDLSPAADGNYGQVILFGRDFDFKYKVADSWGDFLLIFANDLELGNWDIKENVKNNDGDLFIGNEGELVFVDKHNGGLEIPYLEMLKRRSMKKWLDSLENSSDPNVQQLLDELRSSEVSILTLNSKRFQSIDAFINDNLALIDGVKDIPKDTKKQETRPHQQPQPQPHQQPAQRAHVKSPLSNEVTEEMLDEEPLDQEIDKTLEDIDLK
ncbi:KNR4/SMI1 1 [Candida viswanathii]|uniref:KNR4/SMI1 1 n=1 Tax=Candida viswanathii TaxID=5486 RepID=A0A367YHR5_9ASCO|nr:KNR4/SMI1 1 [Candida viswanathii]